MTSGMVLDLDPGWCEAEGYGVLDETRMSP
jgi:hypothetical protein